MRNPILFSLACLLLGSTPAVAILPGTGLSVGVTGGTLGVGPEASYQLNPLLGIRASATFLGVNGHGHVGGYHYDGHLKLDNWGGSIDLHPFANGFRLSAGARRIAANHIRFTGAPTTDQTYGGITYTPAEAGSLSGRIRAKSVAPLATIGFSHTWAPGLFLGFDAGAMYQGHPRVEDLTPTGLLATNPFAQPSLAREEQRLRDKADNYPWYPVAQISLGYRF